jgi:hypothetical protein
LREGVAGPTFGAAPGFAGFLFLGSRAVNSKMLSRANHGHKAGTSMPARSIPHAPVAITMLRRVIFITLASFLRLLLQYTIRHPVPEVYRD